MAEEQLHLHAQFFQQEKLPEDEKSAVNLAVVETQQVKLQ